MMSVLCRDPLGCPYHFHVRRLLVASTCFGFSEGFYTVRTQIWSMGIAWAITLSRLLPPTSRCGTINIPAVLTQTEQWCDPARDSKLPLWDWVKIMFCGTRLDAILLLGFLPFFVPPRCLYCPVNRSLFKQNFQVRFCGTQFRTIPKSNFLLLFSILLTICKS